MKEAEFRAWLEARRWNGKPLSSISSRMSKARRFEKAMPALGLGVADLDVAFDKDGMHAATERLRDWCREAAKTGAAPAELVGQTTNAAMRISNVASAVRNYRQFREDAVASPGAWPALEDLRAAFLDRVPEFERFDLTDNEYERVERTYKDALIAKVRAIAGSNDDDEQAGRRIYRALIPNEGALLSWQVEDDFTRKFTSLAPDFFAGLGRLARSAQPATDAIMIAAAQFERLYAQGATSLTIGQVARVTLTAVGMVRPADAAPFAITKAQQLAKLLTGDPIFTGATLTREMVERWLDLLRRIETVMRDEWDWHPRDLVDVQGFAWTALDERWGNAADTDAPDPEAPARWLKDQQAETSEAIMPQPTNLILYGPPGTGKTFATAARAVALCGEAVPRDRDAVMARYRELSDAGRIRFVTFHQSYSYEDFVEGLRPTTGAEGEQTGAGFRLQAQPGVFREIASLAEQATRAAAGGVPFEVGDRQVFKMSLGRAGEEDHIFDAAIEGGYVVLGWGGEIDWAPFDSYEAIHARWNEDHPGTSGNDGNISQLWRFRCSMRKGDLVVVSYGNSRYRAIGEVIGDYEYAPIGERDYNHRRAVRWLSVPEEPQPIGFYDKPFTMRSCYMLREEHLSRAALALVLPGTGGAPTAPKPFVLICDEINRANISKVFGELITLLEADKRIGAANELKVRLPYSGDAFGVPANLHVIGTMNTADRSIALLDTALRRRFTFEELMPKPELLETVGGIDLAAVLRTLNDRIEYLFDREHQIGHAYFLPCASAEEVHEVMRHKVIPLLQEYFYEDWTKVAAVLGDVFPDDGRRHEGGFLIRTPLASPFGKEEDEGRTRYRWTVRAAETFTYAKLAVAAG